MTHRKRKSIKARGGAALPCPSCGEPTAVLRTQRIAEHVERTKYCERCDHTVLTRETVVGRPVNGAHWWHTNWVGRRVTRIAP